MKTLLALLLGFAVLSPVPMAHARPTPVRDFESRLQALVASGELDPDRADLYRLYAVTDASRLPDALRTESAEGVAFRTAGEAGAPDAWIGRCGTPILRAVRARLEAMTPEVRAEAQAILNPPGPPVSDAAPLTAARTSAKTTPHVLPNWVVTPNFSIEWGSALTNEDGSTPVRDLDGDGVPDVVERWAELFEASFAAETEILKPGALDPPDAVFAGTAVATNLIPVYIGNSAPAPQTIDDIETGFYAFTSTGSPTPYIVVNNDLTFVPSNQDPEGRIRGAMKITAAHELFHVVHFLYEPPVWNVSEDDWWLETSATWMEEEVFDRVNDYYQYFGSTGWTAFVESGLPVPSSDLHYTVRAYGGVIFAEYLSQHVGGRAIMGEMWDLIRPTPAPGRRILDALDVYAQQRGFSGLEELFLGFVGANATMDYEEGAAYWHTDVLPVPFRRFSLNGASVTTNLPNYLGATYLKQGAAAVSSGLTGSFEVQLDGLPSALWGLSLVQKRQDGETLVLGASDAGGQVIGSLSSLLTTDELLVGVSFLVPSDGSGTVPDPGGGGGGGGGGGCFLAGLTGRDLAARIALLAPTSYSVALFAVSATDVTPPAPVSNLQGTAVPGGFDLSWSAPADLDVAGYSVQWGSGHRTVFGRPLGTAQVPLEVRGLSPGTYLVAVYAYDTAGNADRVSATGISVQVTEAAPETTIPAFDTIFQGSSAAP